jgi:hypothetical protein
MLAQAAAFLERRRRSRKPVRIPCWIDRGLLPPIDATVTDYSVAGARLLFEDDKVVAGLPARLTLRLSRAPGTGVTCEVRWRQLLTVGVVFISTLEAERYTLEA